MVKTTIRVDAYLWQLFKDKCGALGLSTCFVLGNLIRAWVTGETRDIPKARPIQVNMTVQYGVTRPRRYPRPSPKEVHLWPPDCKEADVYHKSTREVGCLRVRDWVSLAKCWDCYFAEREVV